MSTRIQFATNQPITPREIPGFPDALKYQFYSKVTDIPEELDLYLKVNPRHATPTKIHAGIIQTCLKEPKKMVLRNAGLILSAKSGKQTSKGLSCEFDDNRKHGLIDGNNSRVAIANAIEQAGDDQPLDECYIEITVYVGLTQGQVHDVASGQNIRKPVQHHSLLNYDGYFDILKHSLGQDRRERISFFEGDDGDGKTMKINFFLQLMMSLNLARYPDGGSCPQVYAHAGKVLRDFKDDFDERDPSPAKLLSENADEIYDAYMLFVAARENLWRGVKSEKGGASRWTVDQSSYAAIDLQFFAALRPIVDWDLDAGSFSWTSPPGEFIPGVGPDLMERIKRTYDKAPSHKKNDTIGKNSDLAELLYERAARWVRSNVDVIDV